MFKKGMHHGFCFCYKAEVPQQGRNYYTGKQSRTARFYSSVLSNGESKQKGKMAKNILILLCYDHFKYYSEI